MLCGPYQPTAGRITIDGTDLARIPVRDWRDRIAGLFQDFARFQFTAGESVGLGDLPRRDDEEALNRAAQEALATEVVDRLPHRWATQLGRQFPSGVELSGGEWQRLALAQTMMRTEPLLLVLDEPASALDPFAEHEIFLRYAATAEANRRRGSITILVSHRFSTVKMADVIVVLADGRITDVAYHDELMRREGPYAELYALQSTAYHGS